MAKLAYPEGVQLWPITTWINGHENFQQTFAKNASFQLFLPDSQPDSTSKYRATTSNFAWLIDHAIQTNNSIRALGNGWSFSDVAVCDGGAIDTKALRLSFAFRDSFVNPDYLSKGKHSSDLFFVQCGMSILQINEKLQAAGRSLKASGASNGQSIAGATATGTHGSAFGVGAVHDTIVGLHLIVSPTRHVWLEKKSNPIVSDDFIKWLGAEKISDDDCFNAAVVSFGSFGFIHGVMLETEPIFLLEQHKSGQIAYTPSLIQTLNSLDFSFIADQLPYPHGTPGKELYHFEALVNPNNFEPGDPNKGVFVRTFYKTPYTSNYAKPVTNDNGFEYGDNTLGVIETILDTLGKNLSTLLVPTLVNKLLPLAFKPEPVSVGTIGETFNNTKWRGKVGSAAIGLDVSHTSEVLEMIVALNKTTPFPGAFSFRFVKGTAAMLGFTKFPITCVVEMDGVDSGVSRNFFKTVWDTLDQKNIPYTLHWGKINFILDAARVRKMYGDDIVDKWIGCRHHLLDDPSRKVFTNDFMKRCGLDV